MFVVHFESQNGRFRNARYYYYKAQCAFFGTIMITVIIKLQRKVLSGETILSPDR